MCPFYAFGIKEWLPIEFPKSAILKSKIAIDKVCTVNQPS